MKSIDPDIGIKSLSSSFNELIEKASKRTGLRSIFESEVKDYAKRNSLPEKRRLLWDYFFYTNYDNIGNEDDRLATELPLAAKRHIDREIVDEYAGKADGIAQKYENQIKDVQKKIDRLKIRWLLSSAFLFVLYLILEFTRRVSSHSGPEQFNFILLILFCIFFAVLSIFLYQRNSRLKKEIAECKTRKKKKMESLYDEQSEAVSDIRGKCERVVRVLRRNMSDLRKMIPPRPDDKSVLEIMKNDAEKIREFAMERMSMTILGEPVDDLQASGKIQPFCEPALLQQEAPESLKILYQSHIEAMKRTDDGDDIYAVNFYKFIIPCQHQINIYSTFYNHIIGKMHGEYTDSFFIRDVVSFSTSTQARELSVRGENVLVTNAMLISIILTSGDRISFNIRNKDFIRTMLEVDKRLEMKRLASLKEELNKELSGMSDAAENSEFISEVKNRLMHLKLEQSELIGKDDCEIDADRTLEGIIKFLRKQLKDHKS